MALRFPNSPFNKSLQYEEFPRSPMGSGSRGAEGDLGLQDFTTFTLQNSAGNEITVAENKITFTNLPVDESCYVSKELSSPIVDFVHRIKFTWDSATAAEAIPGQCQVWGLSALGNFTYIDMYNADDGFLIKPIRSGALYAITFYEMNGKSNDVYITGGVPSTFYIEIERAGTALTAKIYSDSDFSVLLDTLTLTCLTTPMNYLIALGGHFIPPSDDVISGSVENLTIVS